MLSALIPSIHSYPAMPLAEQLVHQRYVHPGPLVLRTDLLKFVCPSIRLTVSIGTPAESVISEAKEQMKKQRKSTAIYKAKT